MIARNKINPLLIDSLTQLNASIRTALRVSCALQVLSAQQLSLSDGNATTEKCPDQLAKYVTFCHPTNDLLIRIASQKPGRSSRESPNPDYIKLLHSLLDDGIDAGNPEELYNEIRESISNEVIADLFFTETVKMSFAKNTLEILTVFHNCLLSMRKNILDLIDDCGISIDNLGDTSETGSSEQA